MWITMRCDCRCGNFFEWCLQITLNYRDFIAPYHFLTIFTDVCGENKLDENIFFRPLGAWEKNFYGQGNFIKKNSKKKYFSIVKLFENSSAQWTSFNEFRRDQTKIDFYLFKRAFLWVMKQFSGSNKFHADFKRNLI